LVQDATTTDGYLYRAGEVGTGSTSSVAAATFTGKAPFTGLDCSWGNAARFATSGGSLELWDAGRSQPVHTFQWGVDQSTSVRFNPAQHNLLASTGSDRSLVLYDARQETPVRKLVTALRANAVAWNPTEPMNLVAACEDSRLHTFDMRQLGMALCTHEGHVSAVLSVDFSPTGREFVSGSYDRTVRIFDARGAHARDMYHTKRMQRVLSVLFSADATYVYSGSDDMNVRMWRADASMPTRPMSRRERDKIDYSRKLVDRHKHLPEVRRIVQGAPVPKAIKSATQLRKTIRSSEKRKDENRRRHGGAKGKRVPERKRNIIAEQK
jgi:WD repeat and SOF domain-containing protein 1